MATIIKLIQEALQETITVTASATIWGGMRFLSYNGNV